jgi:hypothetical protein
MQVDHRPKLARQFYVFFMTSSDPNLTENMANPAEVNGNAKIKHACMIMYN